MLRSGIEFMENEAHNPFDESQEKALAWRFENMLKEKKTLFFDVDELEHLIDYYNSRNETAKAIDVVGYALEIHPNSGTLLVNCAQLYLSIHKPQEALRYLNLAESFEPFNHELFYTKGSIFSQLRQHEKAIEQYKKALEYADSGEKEDICLQLAFENENMDNYDEAINYLKEILNSNPENETALYEIGFCFDVSEKLEEGKLFFSQFVDDQPYSYIGWYNLGITYGKLDLFEKAVSCYDFSIAIKQDFSSAYFNKAHCFSQMGNYTQALECFRETLEIDKEDSLSHYYIGECYEKLEQLNKAISSYKKAIEIDDFIADAWMGISNCYFDLGQYHDSLSHIKKAISLDDNNADYYYLLGDIQAQLGFLEEALISYKKVLEIDEDDESILIDLAKIAEETDNTDLAMDYYCLGVKNQPNNGKLLYNFVAFLLKRGDQINAYFYLDLALKKHFDERVELFDAYAEAMYDEQVIEMIEYYRND